MLRAKPKPEQLSVMPPPCATAARDERAARTMKGRIAVNVAVRCYQVGFYT